MGRTTKYNNITTPELLAQVNPQNMQLKNDFLAYLRSLQRAEGTLVGYSNDLDIFFVWVMQNCNNKDFIKLKKRELVNFQGWLLNNNENSAARVRRIKSAISSLSNYVYNVLAEDEPEEFGDFKPMIRSIESPVNEPVREKLILEDKQCQAMLDKLVEMKKYEQACYLALAFYSGRRKSELLRFKVEHFNDDHLICGGALYSTIEKIRSKGRGKQGKQIPFYILPLAKKYVDLWLAERQELGIESIWMFPDRKNPDETRGVGSADNWTILYSKVLSEITGEETDFYMHCTRHWLTTYFSKLGLPQKVIQAYFNWSSADMINIYDDSDAVDSFGDFFTVDGVKGTENKGLSDL